MKVRVLAGRELDGGLVATWRALITSNPELSSPYFCPEFTLAVSSVRNDVYVGVIEDANRVVGFFPFQRGRGALGRRTAGPVGGQLSDYQALIAAEPVGCRAADLLRQCGLVVWDFDHLIARQGLFAPFHRHTDVSPVMDVRGGLEAYRERRRPLGTSRISGALRKRRKLEREVGPVEFDPDCRDPEVLSQVIAWKSEQCRRTDAFDFFSLDWAVALVRRLAETRSDGFAGALSVLRVGERVAAAHFGMHSSSVWHWWFPGYDAELARYSPGAILLLELADHAHELGVSTIDLGKGDDAYKSSFMTGAVPLAEGSVRRPSPEAAFRAAREQSETFARTSPFAAPLRIPARALLRVLRSQTA